MAGMQCFMRSNASLSYGRIGGEIGQKLSQAAFAVMIKLSGHTDDLKGVLEEIQEAVDFIPTEEGHARDKAILETLELDPRFKDVLNYWIIASRMRSWFSKKRQNLMDRYKIDQKTGEELEVA